MYFDGCGYVFRYQIVYGHVIVNHTFRFWVIIDMKKKFKKFVI